MRLFKLGAIALLGFLVACGSSDDNPQGGYGTGNQQASGKALFSLGLVDGGACSLFDATGNKIAGPVSTVDGVADFQGWAATDGVAQLVCEGGTYTDEATGQTLTAPRLRSYVTLRAGDTSFSSTVTPLTEIAVRLLGNGDPATDFKITLENVAFAFGFVDVDLSTLKPVDVNNQPLEFSGEVPDEELEQHINEVLYGTLLAALSQLQADEALGKTVDEIIAAFTKAITADGFFDDDEVQNKFLDAIESLAANPRLLGKIDLDEEIGPLRLLFDLVSFQPILAEVVFLDTEFSLLQDEFISPAVESGVESRIDVVGFDLSYNLNMTLGEEECRVGDLRPFEQFEVDVKLDTVTAACPPMSEGDYDFVVTDTEANNEEIYIEQVAVGSVQEKTWVEETRYSRQAAKAGGSIQGGVQAKAPTIITDPNHPTLHIGAHDYSKLRTFPVKGVVVELLDAEANNEVISTTTTNDSGGYTFSNTPGGKKVIIRVKAQIKKTRENGVNTGPKYNFMVRDNTSGASPKKLYQFDYPLTAPGENEGVIRKYDTLQVGFDSGGNVTGERQSGPFSILEVVQSAVSKLEQVDANVEMPDLNIYWSPNNIDVSGDKAKGQISTSHYSSGGNAPGVYILGKADVDTDEFDQPVIGHEFGHYLQAVLSYSDNPGGGHSSSHYKDASLAFGEGYGSGVGGLLAGSPIYADASGKGQRSAFHHDLSKGTPTSKPKGFYAEYSIARAMYQMGTTLQAKGKGFTEVWKAVSAMKNKHHSATIFNFYDEYLNQNPSVTADVESIMMNENIRTRDPFGKLNGAVADAKVSKEASKGADDLETLYLDYGTIKVPGSSLPENLTLGSSESFCFNHNLVGAKHRNGLGMSRRFTFVASYTGDLGLTILNDKDKQIKQSTYVTVRSSDGKKLKTWRWTPGFAQYEIIKGKSYTIKIKTSPDTIYGGNQCGNKIQLWARYVISR